MSKRRGKILNDPESLERRKWYSDLQQKTIDEVAKENEFFKLEKCREQQEKQEAAPLQKVEISFKENLWLHAYNSAERTEATLICFPGIGQSSAYFQKWEKTFTNQNILFCAVCLPGRLNRASEECATSIKDISIAVFLALKSMNMVEKVPHKDDNESVNRPLVFFGHDLGCLIAYEVAKLLQDYKYALKAMVVSAAPSPYQQGQNKYGKKICFLSDKELMQRMEELGGIPRILHGRKDFLPYFLPMFRSDYYLYDKYTISLPASVEAVPEERLEVAPPLGGPSRPSSQQQKPSSSSAAARASRVEVQEEEEELVYPVVLYRLHCEVVSLLCEDDPFVSLKDVAEWTHMTNSYEHVALEPGGPGSHLHGLVCPANESAVLTTLLQLCGVQL